MSASSLVWDILTMILSLACAVALIDMVIEWQNKRRK